MLLILVIITNVKKKHKAPNFWQKEAFGVEEKNVFFIIINLNCSINLLILNKY